MGKFIEILKKVPVFTLILFILFIIIPLPIIVIDILIGLNLLFAIIILFLVLKTDKILKFTSLPVFLYISTVFSLIIYISSVRVILTKGLEYNGSIIILASDLIAGTDNINKLYICFLLLIVFFCIIFVISVKCGVRVAEAAARSTLDSTQKILALETELSSKSISEEEVKYKKMEIIKEIDVFGALDGVSIFIIKSLKLIIMIVIMIIFKASVDYLVHGIDLNTVKITYLRLLIGSGFVFFLPIFILTLVSAIVVTRLWRLKEIH
jgi:flagellar biosynthesis protein FlhA